MNFDWDDVSISNPQVIMALNQLNKKFGLGKVWYRTSSSGTGLHVMIADLYPVNKNPHHLELRPFDFSDDLVFQWRQYLAAEPFGLECSGRLTADRERAAHGFRIGRIFFNKNGNNSGPWECYYG
jgi:hypothetical protein